MSRLHNTLRNHGAAIVLCVVYVVALLVFGHACHVVEDARDAENDQYVARAAAILDGHLRSDRYRPLFYPLLTAGATLLLGSPFLAAQTISSLAAGFYVYLVYLIGCRIVSRNGGLLAAVLVAANLYFAMLGVYVTTDMLFSALAAATIYFLVRYAEVTENRYLVFASVCWGLAYFTRYVAVALLPAFIPAVFTPAPAGSRMHTFLKRFFIAAMPAVIVLIPHFVLTYRSFGALLYDENWKNLAYRLYGEGSGVPLRFYDFSDFNGALSVILHSPRRFVLNGIQQLATLFYGETALIGLYGGGFAGGVMSVAVLVWLFRSAFWGDRQKWSMALFVSVYAALVCFTFYPIARLLLPLTGFAALFLSELVSSLLARRYIRLDGMRVALPGVLCGVVAMLIVLETWPHIPAFIAAQPRRAVEVARELQEKEGAEIRVMGTVSFIGHYVDYPYHLLPPAVGKQRSDPAAYFDALCKALSDDRTDFVLIDRITLASRPLSLLRGEDVPGCLELQSRDDDTVLYRVRLP